MEPSEVRQRILDDHTALRGLLAQVDAVARRALGGEAGLESELRQAGESLRERFLAHLALEDAQLVPALRQSDAWGDARAARLETEHAEQRERMEALLGDLRDARRTVDEIARELLTLVDDLLADMEHEERAVLDPDVLRDDVVAIDAEGG